MLTIETRLNLLIGALLLAALAANVALIVLSAGPRIKAENESMVNLARDAVDRGLAEIKATDNPQRELARLVERLSALRHVKVTLQGQPGVEAAAAPDHAAQTRPGRWLARFAGVAVAPQSVPVQIGGQTSGWMLIEAEPDDELDEIVATMRDTLIGGGLVILAMFVITRLVVRETLRPIGQLSTALSGLEQGDFAIALSKQGPPEFREITAKVNDLAASLERARAENRRLAQELVTIEDQERREMAAELHDEFGPYLFAIRANATTLLNDAEMARGQEAKGQDATRAQGASDAAAVRRARACRNLLDQIEAVQQANRRVLHRLRPPALAEIGLERAIEGLVARWRESNPEVVIETSIHVPPDLLPGPMELTVYRVIQEGLTNAFRHAGASAIEVTVAPKGADRVVVAVADNGPGTLGLDKLGLDKLGLDIPADASRGQALRVAVTPGFGLTGMRDRVLALGGSIELRPNRMGEMAILGEFARQVTGQARDKAIDQAIDQVSGLRLEIELPLA
ncbi:MAG: histidine kinase [Hyphomicrobium aestuarii]|nr:histidine kinase [Hyphomicrobium aestuarii]